MFLHHLATISLITFSYVNNMARVGTLVLCLHDSADALLEVNFFPFHLEEDKVQSSRSPRSQQSCTVLAGGLKLLGVNGLHWHENVCTE